MREFMAITKALSDPSRVRILLALRRGELCVCQITELFGSAPSTVSKHLSILHHASLILSRKSERWVYYRLANTGVDVSVRCAIDWAIKSVEKKSRILKDIKALDKILKIDASDLCKRQSRKTNS
jgi:DNA-binding transcriptional ArsR family regulator